MTARGSEARRPRRHSAHSTALRSTPPGVAPLGIENFFLARIGQQAFTLQLLARQLAGAPDCFGLFAHLALGRLFVRPALLHFTEDAFTLHLLLQDAQGLIDVVVAYQYLHEASVLSRARPVLRKAPRLGCQTRGLSKRLASTSVVKAYSVKRITRFAGCPPKTCRYGDLRRPRRSLS